MSASSYNPDFFSHVLQDGILVVRIQPQRLSEEENLEEFANELFTFPDLFECTSLVLDCGALEYASSSALGKIIMLHRKVERLDGVLVLAGLTDSMAEILQAARLYDYFRVAATVPAAVTRVQDDANGAA